VVKGQNVFKQFVICDYVRVVQEDKDKFPDFWTYVLIFNLVSFNIVIEITVILLLTW